MDEPKEELDRDDRDSDDSSTIEGQWVDSADLSRSDIQSSPESEEEIVEEKTKGKENPKETDPPERIPDLWWLTPIAGSLIGIWLQFFSPEWLAGHNMSYLAAMLGLPLLICILVQGRERKLKDRKIAFAVAHLTLVASALSLVFVGLGLMLQPEWVAEGTIPLFQSLVSERLAPFVSALRESAPQSCNTAAAIFYILGLISVAIGGLLWITLIAVVIALGVYFIVNPFARLISAQYRWIKADPDNDSISQAEQKQRHREFVILPAFVAAMAVASSILMKINYVGVPLIPLIFTGPLFLWNIARFENWSWSKRVRAHRISTWVIVLSLVAAGTRLAGSLLNGQPGSPMEASGIILGVIGILSGLIAGVIWVALGLFVLTRLIWYLLRSIGLAFVRLRKTESNLESSMPWTIRHERSLALHSFFASFFTGIWEVISMVFRGIGGTVEELGSHTRRFFHHRARIFISYRRSSEEQVWIDQITKSFREFYGKKNVFRDIDLIELGADFVERIDEGLEASDVLIPIIGKQWFPSPRQEGDTDWVEMEILAALKKNKKIVPVMLDGAAMPSASELPESIRNVAFCNGIRLRAKPDYDRDFETLMDAIDQTMSESMRAKREGRSGFSWAWFLPTLWAAAGLVAISNIAFIELSDNKQALGIFLLFLVPLLLHLLAHHFSWKPVLKRQMGRVTNLGILATILMAVFHFLIFDLATFGLSSSGGGVETLSHLSFGELPHISLILFWGILAALAGFLLLWVVLQGLVKGLVKLYRWLTGGVSAEEWKRTQRLQDLVLATQGEEVPEETVVPSRAEAGFQSVSLQTSILFNGIIDRIRMAARAVGILIEWAGRGLRRMGRHRSRIFLSYRRDNTQQVWIDRIAEGLQQSYGKRRVFRDLELINPGMDFVDKIEEGLKACDVFIPIVGKNWFPPLNPKDTDWVEMEILAALQLKKKMIPVMLEGAAMPGLSELPTKIQNVAFSNGLRLRPEPDFDHDFRELLDAVDELTGESRREESNQRRLEAKDRRLQKSNTRTISDSIEEGGSTEGSNPPKTKAS